jgi:hypothetical protein
MRARMRVPQDDCACGDCPTCQAREWAPFPRPELSWEEWEWITQLLMVRSGGLCEGCGKPFGADLQPSRHHRRARKAGGTSDPTINGLSNLLLLCGGDLAGVTGDHGFVEHNRAWAEVNGLIVRQGGYLAGGGKPPEVDEPVTLRSGRRVLLDPLYPAYTTVGWEPQGWAKLTG